MPALRPYGSSKLRPFGTRSQQDPLKDTRADIEHLLTEQIALIAEEERLFAIVDKADFNGTRDSDKAYDARREWNLVWRKLERNNATLHFKLSRDRGSHNGSS